ncbi:uncharacterized protein TNIN_353611 [Trichonephila inaurata madagascariensis]|uniref:Uncharacterized protein n=1 Tax=Trichonephila inaurata madagascariensis TaxID=2747483 RepID=A0A8X6YHN2_9ARAC|nr:uncharacterized protein TNIN_353611 [Trichonephila inaurata madagascariensis]
MEFGYGVKAQVIWCGFLCSIQGEEYTTVLSTSMNENYSSEPAFEESLESYYLTPSLTEALEVQNTLWPSDPSTELQQTGKPHTYIPSSFASEDIFSSYVPEAYTSLYTDSSDNFLNSLDFRNRGDKSSSSINDIFHSSSSVRTIDGSSTSIAEIYSESFDFESSNTKPAIETSYYSHFHTPLMSLLVASSSLPFQYEESSSVYYSSIPPLPFTTSDNESTNLETSTVPADLEHKKLLMLVLRAEDCSRLSKADFEKMLGKLMVKFGFGEVVPEVSNAKCYSHLNINLTVGNSAPTLRFLPNIDGRNNVTVDVLNRTFRIVKLEKVDLKFEKTKSSNSSSSIIAKVAKHESVAYIAVGVSFGLVLVICITVCFIKCCCLRKTQKRFNPGAKCSHMRLRPEDYTLTPIPRPTSLYVDYYRGSVSADIYSTTSAGSIASTTPTVEKGVVQPFDTSIVPLEDSAALPFDTSRDPSVESVPAQSDMKTFNIHNFANKGLRNAATDSKEQLNPKQNARRVVSKTSGVANPTFQRY